MSKYIVERDYSQLGLEDSRRRKHWATPRVITSTLAQTEVGTFPHGPEGLPTGDLGIFFYMSS
jgi:hypothetical protein